MKTYAGLTKEQLDSYDYFIVAFSGGKDSEASFLHLLDCGVPKSKVELWHHAIDGMNDERFMDWPVTENYCEQFAKRFEVPLYYSCREGGFKAEMLRENKLTNRVLFEVPVADNPDEDNLIECGIETRSAGGKGRGKINTRLKFPQVSGDLKVRWCSSYLKITVCTSAICNQERFISKRTLVISGERAEESPKRSKYAEFEKDPADRRDGKLKRHVDRARPVHKWLEAEVWEIIERYRVNPHPAYRLGWGRLSCMACIFGSKNQWASVQKIAPQIFNEISEFEQLFEYTIHRDKSVEEMAQLGTAYDYDLELAKQSQQEIFIDPLIVDQWQLPMGAFGESNGPT